MEHSVKQMHQDDKIEFIRNSFPGAQLGRLFIAKLNVFLESKGFHPKNTIFAEGMCSDELNEAECEQMELYWGERFKYGGLAGYCHGGITGLQLALANTSNKENYESQNVILYGGPHIGCNKKDKEPMLWGRISRKQQTNVTGSCGSLTQSIKDFSLGKKPRKFDPFGENSNGLLDNEQIVVEHLLYDWYKKNVKDTQDPQLIPHATKFLSNLNQNHLCKLVQKVLKSGKGCKKIAVVSGVTINTCTENYFWPDKLYIFCRKRHKVTQKDFHF